MSRGEERMEEAHSWLPVRYELCDELIQYSQRGLLMSCFSLRASGSNTVFASERRSLCMS